MDLFSAIRHCCNLTGAGWMYARAEDGVACVVKYNNSNSHPIADYDIKVVYFPGNYGCIKAALDDAGLSSGPQALDSADYMFHVKVEITTSFLGG